MYSLLSKYLYACNHIQLFLVQNGHTSTYFLNQIIVIIITLPYRFNKNWYYVATKHIPLLFSLKETSILTIDPFTIPLLIQLRHILYFEI